MDWFNVFLECNENRSCRYNDFIFTDLQCRVSVLFMVSLYSFFCGVLDRFAKDAIVTYRGFSFEGGVTSRNARSSATYPSGVCELGHFCVRSYYTGFVASFTVAATRSNGTEYTVFSLDSLDFSTLTVISDTANGDLFSTSTSFA